MASDDIVSAMLVMVERYIDERLRSNTTYAVWNAANVSDPDLSSITLPSGDTLSGVPKYAHVTGLLAGDVVECIHAHDGKRLTIIGKPIGNPSVL